MAGNAADVLAKLGLKVKIEGKDYCNKLEGGAR